VTPSGYTTGSAFNDVQHNSAYVGTGRNIQEKQISDYHWSDYSDVYIAFLGFNDKGQIQGTYNDPLRDGCQWLGQNSTSTPFWSDVSSTII
jgi:hypothetical protein